MSLFSFLNRNKKSLQQLGKYDFPAKNLQGWQDFIRNADDCELYRVNPRYLAEKLDWNEQQVLDVLTLSTAEDLWSLEWESFCAACGNLVQSATELSHLHSPQKCEACGGEGDIQLDREVIARASIDEGLRQLDRRRRDDPDFREQVDEQLGRVSSLHLINRPLFRELLGEQILPSNQSLGVQNLSIFFSDLKQSTRLYQHLGDARAYELVREHFDIVFDAVERHGGSAVKTIGDGVMGTFFDSASALKGVTESVMGLDELNVRAGLTEEDSLQLKVGLHAGACIVVTLNSRLDYFGSTVNIAARLSDMAQGGEVLLSKKVLEDSNARAFAEEMKCDQEQLANLRGVMQAVEICRMRPGAV
jgi:class 3 adenylate cyclase